MEQVPKDEGAKRLIDLLYDAFKYNELFEDSKRKSEICHAAYRRENRCKFQDECDFAHSTIFLCRKCHSFFLPRKFLFTKAASTSNKTIVYKNTFE